MTFKHIPLHPARDSVPMEGFYLSLWKNFAEQRPEEWAAIFSYGTHTPRQRAASVAASFMVFMGCNGGRAFTLEADRLTQTGTFFSKESAYLAAWSIENERRSYVNSGLRTIEYMLASEYPIRHNFPGGINWHAVPVITMEDHDVIEGMVRWWAGITASVIRQHAANLLAAHKSNERLQHNLHHNKP